MATTNVGEYTVLVETPLQPANPRGITADWLIWNVTKNIPTLSEQGRTINWKVIAAGAVLAVGLVMVLRRK